MEYLTGIVDKCECLSIMLREELHEFLDGPERSQV